MRLRSKLLLLAPQLVVVGIGAVLYASLYNTLERNGAWVATKTLLHKRVIGASAFFTSRQTLAGQELDLGRWLGFQEVVHREPLPLKELSLRFRLVENARLDVLYNKDEHGFCGLRIGTGATETFSYRADPTGRFLERAPVPFESVAADGWQRLRIELGGVGNTASLNGAPPAPLLGKPHEQQRFGFRNGLRSAVVDDVRIRTRDGAEIRETFANPSDLLLALGAGILGLLVLNTVAFVLLRRVRWTPRQIRTTAFLGLSVVGGAVVFLAYYQVFLAKSYRSADSETEQEWRQEHAGHVDASIQQYFGGPPDPDVVRVLVVGTSQSWGAGATAPGDTFVEVLERRLQEQPLAGGRYECVNAGVSGLRATWLLALYRERWLTLEPDVVVLNLSNNDTDPEVFASALEGFLETNEPLGIATVFALEANSIEARPHGLPLHETMRGVAQEHSIPVVDVHAFLKERGDVGLLWWDLVHPTTLGHALIAEALAPEVRAAAGSRAASEQR